MAGPDGAQSRSALHGAPVGPGDGGEGEGEGAGEGPTMADTWPATCRGGPFVAMIAQLCDAMAGVPVSLVALVSPVWP